MPIRVGFLTTHPIQYQVPVFRELARYEDFELTVLFCQIPDAATQGADFGLPFDWDVPLLDGYRYEVLTNVARHPSVLTFWGCDTPEIAARIGKHQFDVLIVNGWNVKSCLQALAACRRHGVPCVVRGEANMLRPRPWWKNVLHRRLVRQFSAYLYIGSANRAYYEHFGAKPSVLFPAPYCVDNSRFQAAAEDVPRRAAARQRWRIPNDATCFAYCGKFIAKKHPLELLSAGEQAISRGAKVHFLMAGDGELRANVEHFARERNLPVTFTGFLNQTQVVDAYLASDCLVLPSDAGETWGLVVNESMACGRPAIVSDLVGCRADLIIEGVTGASFRFGDWSSLGQLLAVYAKTPDQLRALGKSARKHIATYSPQAAAAGMAEAIGAVHAANPKS